MERYRLLKMFIFLMVLMMLFGSRSSKIIEGNTEDKSSPLTTINGNPMKNDTQELSDNSSAASVSQTVLFRHKPNPFSAILKEPGENHNQVASGNLSDTVVRACNSNMQCHTDECCLQKPWSNHFFCAKRIREGKVCWSRPHNATENWDKYRVICPCIHKHECKFQDPIFILKPVLAASTCQPKEEEEMM